MFNIFYEISKILDDIFEYTTLSKRDKVIYRKVPYTCFYCELLGICRDENNDWKCRHGCMVLNAEREIPYTCEKCKLLKKCRDENNDWKCRHGCIVLNEKRAKKKRIKYPQ